MASTTPANQIAAGAPKDVRLQRLESALEILQGTERAQGMWAEVSEAIVATADHSEALAALLALGFSEVQALHVLDLRLGLLSETNRSELAGQITDVQSELARVRIE